MADLLWIDADGTSFPLSDGVIVERGSTGMRMPPVRFTAEVVPGQPGTRVREVQHASSEVALALVVHGDWETQLRAWAHRFDPVRGDGTIRSSGRELACRYVGGIEQAKEDAPTRRRFVAVFRAFDPYWYDTSDRVQTFTAGEAATFFPLFPLTLSSSEVYADAAVANDGDVEAWPVWTITGPGSNPVLRNLTTGKNLSLTYTLSAGQTITVDTRPGQKTVTLDDGTNLFGNLSSSSSLWSLQAGLNSVRIELTSATADSEVTLTYRRRYLAA